MFECHTLLLPAFRTVLRDGSELLTENLPLRHRLAVLTHPPAGGPGSAPTATTAA